MDPLFKMAKWPRGFHPNIHRLVFGDKGVPGSILFGPESALSFNCLSVWLGKQEWASSRTDEDEKYAGPVRFRSSV